MIIILLLSILGRRSSSQRATRPRVSGLSHSHEFCDAHPDKRAAPVLTGTVGSLKINLALLARHFLEICWESVGDLLRICRQSARILLGISSESVGIL